MGLLLIQFSSKHFTPLEYVPSKYLAIPSLSFATALTTKILEVKEQIAEKKQKKNIFSNIFSLKGFAYTSLIVICIYYLTTTMIQGNYFHKHAEQFINLKILQQVNPSKINIDKFKNQNYKKIQELFKKYTQK